MARYIESSLIEGETIVAVYRHHWTTWLWFWLFIILAIPTLGLTLFLALYQYLRLKGWERATTNKRIVVKTGIISRKTEEMRLESIETVEIEQTAWQRILGSGSVTVTGRGDSTLLISSVDDPPGVKKSIESALV
ncbi:MAG: PH domain-containing protein [Bacteroidales bacterium]|nr:PH domain-containing protein [Bacteroidales bacterium]